MKCQVGLGLITSSVALCPQGEPGMDGAAGKEVPLCWASNFLSGMLLLAPGFALDPFIHSSVDAPCMYRLSLDGYTGNWCPCYHRRGTGTRKKDESEPCFSLFFFFKPYTWSKKKSQ